MSADAEPAESQRDSAGFFSSAKTFFLPLGPRIHPAGVAGYPIDFRVKAKTPVWPPEWLPLRERQLWVDIAQWGLGCFERHLAGEGERWLEGARAAGEHLVAEQDDDGAWLHLFRYPHSLPLPPPWPSAMAQGEGASLLVRLHAELGDERYAEAARRALRPMTVPTEEGGTLALLGGRPFPEEYPTRPPSFVLNGGIFAIWGFRDVGVGLGDPDAERTFREMAETLALELHRWDTGRWSRYDLFPHPVTNPASSFYHRLHIHQLQAMMMLAPHPEIGRVLANFERYMDSTRHNRMAFVQKGVYRLVVPRNRFLAHRLPWTRKLAR